MSEFCGTFPGITAITRQMDAGAPSDADLMRRTAAGDRDAFAEIYRRHHDSVYRFARLMTGSSSVAEDVVQDVFLCLMKDAARYDAARSSLSTYLYGVARHRTRRSLLRLRRLVAIDEEAPIEAAPGGDVLDDLARRADLQRLRRAILALPARYREVLVMCDLQDVSYADAAAALGWALGTVRSRLHRARHLLTVKMRRASACADGREPSTVRCPV
jgi:RNA polymerase sigma-70 factor (ECF subfamily)